MDTCIQQERRKDGDDYYHTLGCHRSSSEDQILAEYKYRVLLYHPDKNQDNDTSTTQFQKLQEAKEVLCDPDKRKNYDRWQASGIAISYKQWVALNERSAVVFHWAMPKHGGKMLESTSNTLERAKKEESQHSFIVSNPHFTHNSILEKFRNYEI